ncbi:MAG: hypothetical protein CL902_00800 [Dehalococcoidia bacterium]|nr:hypothetical protein [Dehalococcoidia bacterium]
MAEVGFESAEFAKKMGVVSCVVIRADIMKNRPVSASVYVELKKRPVSADRLDLHDPFGDATGVQMLFAFDFTEVGLYQHLGSGAAGDVFAFKGGVIKRIYKKGLIEPEKTATRRVAQLRTEADRVIENAQRDPGGGASPTKKSRTDTYANMRRAEAFRQLAYGIPRAYSHHGSACNFLTDKKYFDLFDIMSEISFAPHVIVGQMGVLSSGFEFLHQHGMHGPDFKLDNILAYNDNGEILFTCCDASAFVAHGEAFQCTYLTPPWLEGFDKQRALIMLTSAMLALRMNVAPTVSGGAPLLRAFGLHESSEHHLSNTDICFILRKLIDPSTIVAANIGEIHWDVPKDGMVLSMPSIKEIFRRNYFMVFERLLLEYYVPNLRRLPMMIPRMWGSKYGVAVANRIADALIALWVPPMEDLFVESV